MTIGLCKNCKFWGEENSQVKTLRKCNRAPELWECVDWVKDDAGESDYDQKIILAHKTDHKMFVQDGSDYVAELYTKCDFGCVEFSEAGDQP